MIVVIAEGYRTWAGLALAGFAVAGAPIRIVRRGATGRELIAVLAGTARVQLVVGLLLARRPGARTDQYLISRNHPVNASTTALGLLQMGSVTGPRYLEELAVRHRRCHLRPMAANLRSCSPAIVSTGMFNSCRRGHNGILRTRARESKAAGQAIGSVGQSIGALLVVDSQPGEEG